MWVDPDELLVRIKNAESGRKFGVRKWDDIDVKDAERKSKASLVPQAVNSNIFESNVN